MGKAIHKTKTKGIKKEVKLKKMTAYLISNPLEAAISIGKNSKNLFFPSTTILQNREEYKNNFLRKY